MRQCTTSTSNTMTSQQASNTLNTLLSNVFHNDFVIYPNDITISPLNTEAAQLPLTNNPLVSTYMSILSLNQLLANMPMSTTSQGTYTLPNHAVEAILSILSYHLPHNIDAHLHNFQWFLIGQGPHPCCIILIPFPHNQLLFPLEHIWHCPKSYIAPWAQQVTCNLIETFKHWFNVMRPPTQNVYVDDNTPLSTPPHNPDNTEFTNEAKLSLDLARV